MCFIFGFFPPVCLAFLSYYSYVWFCFVLFYSSSLDAGLLSNERKNVDSDGRGEGKDLGEVKGGKTVIKIDCMKKIYLQSKKNRKKFKIICTIKLPYLLKIN